MKTLLVVHVAGERLRVGEPDLADEERAVGLDKAPASADGCPAPGWPTGGHKNY